MWSRVERKRRKPVDVKPVVVPLKLSPPLYNGHWSFDPRQRKAFFPFASAQKYVPRDAFGTLRGTIKQHYSKLTLSSDPSSDVGTEECLYSLCMAQDGNVVYVYTVMANPALFGDKMGIFEVHLSCKLEDLHLAYPSTRLFTCD